MLQLLLAIAIAIERLVPFLTKLLDAAAAAREDAKRRADEKALADSQAAKDARNAKAMSDALK